MMVERWIMDIERTFEVCGCIESQKLLYASYLLQGEAVVWCDTKRHLITMELGVVEGILWVIFKKKFDDHYFRMFGQEKI